MKKSQRAVSLVLASVLAAVSFSGCSESENADESEQESTPDTVAEAANPTESETDEETKDLRFSDSAEVKDLGGITFMIYGCHSDGGGYWRVHDMLAEEITGEAVNDAIYDRNMFFEETYNFKIDLAESDREDIYQDAVNFSAAGDTSYDAYGLRAYTGVKLGMQGLAYDLKELPYLDWSAFYWAQSLHDQLTLNNKLYLATGDITVVTKEGVRAYYFNKTMIDDYHLENPYDLVREGKWTYEQMFSMMDAAKLDLDGDGDMDGDDRWGMMGQSLTGMVLYQGSGDSIVSKDEDDLFVINADSERSMGALLKVTELMEQKSDCVYITDDWQKMLNMFENQQALFYTEVMTHIETMRSYDVDFGVIPTPKYEESQDKYYQYLESNCCIFYSVPHAVRDEELSAYILEVLAASSSQYITPAYYDICLKSKYARDKESSEMLDIIFSSYHMELAQVYNFSSIYSTINSCLTNGGSIASKIASVTKVTNKLINKTIQNFTDNNGW